MKPSGNEDLHITSILFDEPLCVQLVKSSQVVVAVHGCAGEHKVSYVGGLDEKLKTMVIEALKSADFNVEEDISYHSGKDRRNICNKNKSGRGLQIEITMGLRCAMFKRLSRRERQKTTPVFEKFVTAIRDVLLGLQEV
jgi:phage replication-related protein YjqB (UPF0714/DUF867 family)